MNRIAPSWRSVFAIALVALIAVAPQRASAQSSYTVDELVTTGETFFGQVAGNLASVVEHAVSEYGLPNGYILGETFGGAILIGGRTGDGTLYTRNLGSFPICWGGLSIGLDVGADASRTMMLVYNLPTVDALYQRFSGVSGSAYVVGGVGMTVQKKDDIVIVPIVAGVGARLGINIGFLRFEPSPC